MWLPFADRLTVSLQEQEGALTGVKLLWDLGLDEFLSFPIGNAVVLSFQAEDDAHEHVRAIGWHRGDRSFVGEEKDAVDAGVGNIGKPFQGFAYSGDGSSEKRIEVAAVFVYYALRDLLEPRGAEFSHHAAGFERGG